MKPRPMSKDEFKASLDKLDLRQGDAAKFLDLSLRTVHGYANGAKISRPVQLLLRLMIKLKLNPEELV